MAAALHDGEMCAPGDPRACYFCLVGALDRVTEGKRGPEYKALWLALADAVSRAQPGAYLGVVSFNDMHGTTVQDVLGLIDDAIAQIR